MVNESIKRDMQPTDVLSKKSEMPYNHDCPLGGDIANDCADCIYSGDFHYDYEKQDCVMR